MKARQFIAAFLALCCAAAIIAVWVWLNVFAAIVVAVVLWPSLHLIDKYVLRKGAP